MPTCKNNILDSEIIEEGVIPSLISWKSMKPIYNMNKTQFELISLEILLAEAKQNLNVFFKSFGEIEHVSILSTFQDNATNFRLKLKDNVRNIVISL